MPSGLRNRFAAAAAVATLCALTALVLPASGSAVRAHAATKLSAKKTCAKFGAGAVGKALGVTVKRASIRDSLDLGVGDRSLGFECAFYPAHPTEQFPEGDYVANVDIARTLGSAKKFSSLIARGHFPGTTPTKVAGIGSLAYVDLAPVGTSGEELPQIVVFVKSHEKIFYVYSKEITQPAAEALARVVASKL